MSFVKPDISEPKKPKLKTRFIRKNQYFSDDELEESYFKLQKDNLSPVKVENPEETPCQTQKLVKNKFQKKDSDCESIGSSDDNNHQTI